MFVLNVLVILAWTALAISHFVTRRGLVWYQAVLWAALLAFINVITLVRRITESS